MRKILINSLLVIMCVSLTMAACAGAPMPKESPVTKNVTAQGSREITAEVLNALAEEVAESIQYNEESSCKVTFEVAPFNETASEHNFQGKFNIGALRNEVLCCSRDVTMKNTTNSMELCGHDVGPDFVDKVEIMVSDGYTWSRPVLIWEHP